MADPPKRSPTLAAQAAKVVAACGGGLLVLLLLRNRDLFTQAIYEAGDPASNSMLTIQAKHFALFTGHYSRVGFTIRSRLSSMCRPPASGCCTM